MSDRLSKSARGLKRGKKIPILIRKQRSKLCLTHGKLVLSCAFLLIKQSLVTFSDKEKQFHDILSKWFIPKLEGRDQKEFAITLHFIRGCFLGMTLSNCNISQRPQFPETFWECLQQSLRWWIGGSASHALSYTSTAINLLAEGDTRGC